MVFGWEKVQPDAAHVIPFFSFIFANMKAAERGTKPVEQLSSFIPNATAFGFRRACWTDWNAAVVGGRSLE